MAIYLTSHDRGKMHDGGATRTLPVLGNLRTRLSAMLFRHEPLRGYLLLAPALLIMAAAILMPLGTMILMSFWSISGYDIDKTLSLGNYQAMLEHPIYSALILRSLKVSAIATLVTIALCYPMAYFVAFHVKKNKPLWLLLMTLPFWTSYLLRVFALKVVLGYEGLLNSALLSLGLIKEPLVFLLYSQTAVTIGLAHSWAVFALLPIYVSLEKIDKSYIEAAANLGDAPMQRFWRVVFPLSLPGVAAAFFMMFIPTVGDYITPAMLGGPDGMMVGNLIMANFGAMNNQPAGSALAVVMILAITFAAIVFISLTRLIRS